TGSNGDATCGGFFANMEGEATLKNCAFLGSIKTGTAEGNGLLVGWAGSGSNNKYENCFVAPVEYTQNGNSADFARNNPSTTNYFRVAVDDATLASGELCFKLGGGNDWYQLLGTDAYPVPFNSHAKVSYVGDAGYATMYNTTTGYTLNGVKAYAAVLSGTRLALTEVENVPESTPVVLKGTYYNKIADDTLPAINVANDLKGTDADTAADGTMYILANGADGVGFYKAEGTIPAGKAYFQSSTGVKAFFFDGDDATGISGVDANLNANDAIYNIAGQRIQKMQKGINIINGKKVLF
ncbi:MAG: hypothetical protein IKM68_08450, partial [Bacteroidaceae bacterium]|nr:hypothetical protein [Bacteroidaceae bacterium]